VAGRPAGQPGVNGQERLEARVHGQVQGVGYRWFVRRHAARLGLSGWVANEPAGSVRLIAEGSRAAIDELAALLAEGPAGASVERVDGSRLPASGGFVGFEIRAGSHRGD